MGHAVPLGSADYLPFSQARRLGRIRSTLSIRTRVLLTQFRAREYKSAVHLEYTCGKYSKPFGHWLRVSARGFCAFA